jgi:hypothetical protein
VSGLLSAKLRRDADPKHTTQHSAEVLFMHPPSHQTFPTTELGDDVRGTKSMVVAESFARSEEADQRRRLGAKGALEATVRSEDIRTMSAATAEDAMVLP